MAPDDTSDLPNSARDEDISFEDLSTVRQRGQIAQWSMRIAFVASLLLVGLGAYALFPPTSSLIAIGAFCCAALFLAWGCYILTSLQRCPACGVLSVTPAKSLYCPICSELIRPKQVVNSEGVLDFACLYDSKRWAQIEVIQKFIAMIILLAIKEKAPQLKLEKGSKSAGLSYTVNGNEFELVPPPEHLFWPIVQTLQAAAGLDHHVAAEAQKSQLSVQFDGPPINLDLQITPISLGGSRVVLTIPTDAEVGAFSP